MGHNLAYFGVMELVSCIFFFDNISELWRGTQLYPYIYINVYDIAGTGKTILAYSHPSSPQYK